MNRKNEWSPAPDPTHRYNLGHGGKQGSDDQSNAGPDNGNQHGDNQLSGDKSNSAHSNFDQNSSNQRSDGNNKGDQNGGNHNNDNQNSGDENSGKKQVQKQQQKKRGTVISVREMGDLLGLKKTERYWLIHKNFLRRRLPSGKCGWTSPASKTGMPIS